jgi:hypothetical protein
MNIVGNFENKESEKTIKETLSALQGDTYYLEVMNLADLCSKPDWNLCDAVLMDTKAWQHGKTILKYFGVLPKINEKPMLILTLDTKKQKLKSRDSNKPFITVSPYASANEIVSSIKALQEG